jgi:hypothetical protein
VEAKKQAFSNYPQKAMSNFKEAFNRAGELKDTETQSRICLEIGKIYDDNDFVAQALNSYYKSLQYTTSSNDMMPHILTFIISTPKKEKTNLISAT